MSLARTGDLSPLNSGSLAQPAARISRSAPPQSQSIEDDDPIFATTGGREADTEVSLTGTGENIAEVFDDQEELRPVERVMLCGLQPYESGFGYLSLLDEHREDGIFRPDLEETMVDRYGGKEKYFTGYFTSWYSRLGLMEKEQVGRKKKFHPSFPEGW